MVTGISEQMAACMFASPIQSMKESVDDSEVIIEVRDIETMQN
jgi:hypothetical protein